MSPAFTGPEAGPPCSRRTSTTSAPNISSLARSPFSAAWSGIGPCSTVFTGSTETISRSKSSSASGGRVPPTRIS